MYNNQRGIARAAITAALTFSMSVGGMPLVALADQTSDDAAQPQLTASAEAAQAEGKTQEASAPSTLSAAGEEEESQAGNDAENPDADGESQDGEDTSGDENKQDDGVTQGEEVTSTEGGDATTDSGDVKHGTWGTCTYDLSADGTLTVHPGELEKRFPSDVDRDSVKRVVFVEEEGKKAIARQDSETGSSLPQFSGMKALESVDLSGLDVSHVTDLSYWFGGCAALTSVKLDGIDTSKVQNFSNMFGDCTSLKELDASKLDVTSATDISGMFYECNALETIDVSHWNVSNVKRFQDIFWGCDSVKVLDLSGWDTSSVDAESKTADLFEMLPDGHPRLELVKVGEKVAMSTFPYGLAGQEVIDRYGDDVRPSGHYWYSWKDSAWYEEYEIYYTRMGTADTYSKYKPGEEVKRTIATNVITDQGAPTITWNNAADMAPTLLTSDELSRFNAGEDATVWLQVSVIPTDDAYRDALGTIFNAVGLTTDSAVAGMYNITLWKKVGNDVPTIIPSATSPLDLSLEVPGELRNGNSDISRLFQLFHMNTPLDSPSSLVSGNIAADVFKSAFDKQAETSNNSIGFQTSSFSTFVLTYSDSNASNSDSGQNNQQNNTNNSSSKRATSAPVSSTKTAKTSSTTKSSTATPKTADASIGGFAATAASGFAALLYGLRRKKRDE